MTDFPVVRTSLVFVAVNLLVGVALAAPPAPAPAASPAGPAAADAEAQKLIKGAMDVDYLNMNFDAARKKLQQAAAACRRKGCTPSLHASIHGYFAVIHWMADDEQELAADDLRNMLRLDAEKELDEKYSTEEMETAWEEARRFVLQERKLAAAQEAETRRAAAAREAEERKAAAARDAEERKQAARKAAEDARKAEEERKAAAARDAEAKKEAVRKAAEERKAAAAKQAEANRVAAVKEAEEKLAAMEAKYAEDQKRAAEEAKAEAARKAAEEAKRAAEEKKEAARKAAEDAKRAAEDKKEAARRAVEEKKEAARRAVEEKKEAALRAAEEAKRLAEEKKEAERKAAEEKREAALKAAEEAKRAAEEKKEAERKAIEDKREAALKAAEEAKRAAEEKKEAARRAAEEKKAEEARKAKEAREAEEERRNRMPPPVAKLVEAPWKEQAVGYPIPILVKLPPPPPRIEKPRVEVVKVVTEYQGPGIPPRQIELKSEKPGEWVGVIPCDATTKDGEVTYYTSALNKYDNPVARGGSLTKPNKVRIRSELVSALPHNPGELPPESCADSERKAKTAQAEAKCNPGDEGCKTSPPPLCEGTDCGVEEVPSGVAQNQPRFFRAGCVSCEIGGRGRLGWENAGWLALAIGLLQRRFGRGRRRADRASS